MAQKSKGMRRKTRKKLARSGRRAGPISGYMRTFEDGTSAVIHIDPAVQEGMPHPRFHGRTVTVDEQRGRSYVVKLKDGGKTKAFTVHPAHLRQPEE